MIQASLQTHKNKQDTLDKAGVYRIPCGETGRNISARAKEHQAHGRLGHLAKSAIIKHSPRTRPPHQLEGNQTHRPCPVLAPTQSQGSHRHRVVLTIHLQS